MPRLAAELALPDPSQSRLRFDRAARSFASACFIHDEARRRLLERLEAFRLAPETLVDLGSALGDGARALKRRFPDGRVLALDSSRAMLARAAAGDYRKLAADATRLPLVDASVDLVFANLVLPWLKPEDLFAEARRVLKPEGVVVFSTFGPGTLLELRRAWSAADDAVHVHAFWDMPTLGDLAVAAGLEEPVLDADRLRVSYAELSGAIRDLRAMGATNSARGRRRGLTGRGRWHDFVEALWRQQGEGRRGRLSLGVELICGQAFGARTAARTVGGEIRVPVDELSRARVKRHE